MGHRTQSDHAVNESLGAYNANILARHRRRGTDNEARPVEMLKGLHNFFVNAHPAPAVRLFFIPFNAQHNSHIAQIRHSISLLLGEQSTVRVNLEENVGVVLHKLEEIRIDQGLTTQYGHKIDSQFLTFTEHLMGHVQGELCVHTISQRVTAATSEVTPPGGAQNKDERWAKTMLFLPIIPFASPHEPGVQEQGMENPSTVFFREPNHNTVEEFSSRMILPLQQKPYFLNGLFDHGVSCELFAPLRQLNEPFLRNRAQQIDDF